MTKASGEAAGAEKVEVSVDNGKTFKAVELKAFDDALKGKLAAQVRITFTRPLKALKLEAIVQQVYLTWRTQDSAGEDWRVPTKGTPVYNIVSLLPIACALVLGIMVLAANSTSPAAETPAPIATFALADLPDAQFERGAWSKPVSEGGVRFRQALAGKFAAARVKAWWKEDRLRPAEGERFVLEVRYRDSVAKPAAFHVFSGIGRNFGYSAIHQFGGANDGQWKTAGIPVPWDMVARLVSTLDPARNAPDMTAFAISAGADLPVASVAVRKAVPEDEERFYAECRALIAGAQAAARVQNPPPAVKDPPAVTGPLAAFPWEPSCRLFQNCAGVPGQMGKPVKVRMCLDELEPGSFGVYANAALTGVDYRVTPLTGASGRTLQATVERRTAEYALLDGQWAPMRLWPAYAVDIPAGRSHWFFFNIETQRGVSAAGTYKGKILITAKEGKAELPLEVEVLPVDLLTMDEAGLTMFGCYDRLPPLHDVEFQRRYNYGGALLWYAGFAPPVALREGKLAFDFTYPDDWMKGARKRGFTGAIWYLGGDSAKMPRTLRVFAHLGTLDQKMTFNQWCTAQNGQDHVLPETRKLFVEWMRQVNAHAVDNDWLELFPTPHDEPQKWASIAGWIKPFFKDACAAIREADPRIRVYGCIHHVKGWKGVPDLWKVFIDDIDVYNTNAVGEDPDVGNKVRAAGAESVRRGGKDKLFWQYTGLGGGVPDSQRFAFGFFFGAFGSTGCTAWAYNWNDVWDLSGRRGDLAVTAWPTAYQTIPSPWFEGQREGLDDRRIIATYQKRFARDAEAMQALEGVLTEARTSRSKGSGENKEAGFYDSIDDSAKLIRWRNALLERLANAGR